MKKFLFSLIVGFLFLSFNSSFAQKIGYLDLNYILNKSKIGQRYSSQLKPKLKKAEQQLKTIEAKLRKLDKELKSSLLSEEVKRRKYIQYQNLLQERQSIYINFQREKVKVEKELLNKIGKVIKEYAEKNKYDLILTGNFQNGVLYIGDKINITKDILNYIDKRLK
ncbi:MAG: hypothetical protein DSY60_01260 [Persephonella sp.]|nr:MAG: hypothetical protein DSY60_01260 [Persephonella sp.]